MVRPELQLRRSEWKDLRRQLDNAHRINQFELYYDAYKLCRYWDVQYEKSRYKYKYNRSEKEISKLEVNTVFFTLSEESCYSYHSEIFEIGQIDKLDDDYSLEVYGINGMLGYMVTSRSRKALIDDQKRWEQEQRRKQQENKIPQKC